MKNNKLPDPNKLAIRDIEKFEGRVNKNVRTTIETSASAGVCLAFTAVFGALGLLSVANNEFIGKSLACLSLTLLSASGLTFATLKTLKLYSRILEQNEIFKDMATNQFEIELEKKSK